MNRSKGFSLLEALVAVAVLGIVLASALPSLADTRDLQAVRSSYEALRGDFELAQFESIKRNRTVSMTFRPAAACWGISTLPTCDCSLSSSAGGCDIKRSDAADLLGVTLQTASFEGASTTVFEPVRGTALPGSIALSSPRQRRLTVSLNSLGLVTACTPVAAVRFDRWRVCT